MSERTALAAIEHAIWKLGTVKDNYEAQARRASDGRASENKAAAWAIEQAITIVKQCRDLRSRHEFEKIPHYGRLSDERKIIALTEGVDPQTLTPEQRQIAADARLAEAKRLESPNGNQSGIGD